MAPRKPARSTFHWSAALWVVLLLAALPAVAQNFVLDRPVRAGELTLFPDLDDENTFYYVSDKARLAVDDAGRPKFSFLRYVDNVRSADERVREGEGGGIVHAVVTLEVTQDQLREAQRALQRVKPGGIVRGPAIFQSGTFGLVSSFAEADGEVTRRVVGLGTAPILDGQKAAVSLMLTKQGAKILWESFQTSTPDISFSFEMELAGYRSPRRALIEANFDQIYEHQGFSAGIASTYLAAEIKGSFDDLQRSGAIKLTQVGSDEKLDELVTTAYNRLTEMMFQPIQGTGTPSLASLAGGAGGGQGSLLDRATRHLNENRERVRADNAEIRRENERNRARDEARERNRPEPRDPPAGGGGDEDGEDEDDGEEEPRPEGSYSGNRPAEIGDQLAEETGAEPRRNNQRQEQTEPSFAIVAAFEMKKVRQRGEFKIDLNKYTVDTLTMRFDQNIGDMTRFLGDERHFKQVNLDDPLFTQREITVFLDGLNLQDFADFINFVTVQMRKRHAGGDETFDEVRIDRTNFQAQANNFKMLYGFKGDTDRSRWLEYEYQVLWSFHGGHTVEIPWQTATFDAVNVASPLVRRQIDLEVDPGIAEDEGMRLVTVQVYYNLGDQEKSVRATLRPSRQQLSASVHYIAPVDAFDYQYDVSWRLQGNRSVSLERTTSNEAVLFVDELPEGGE